MKKHINILFLFLVIAPFLYAQEGIDIWTTTTISIGRVYGMVIDDSSPSTMYACGLDQGVYKTTDSGVSWTPMNNGIQLIQVQTLAISKNNPQYLLAGTATGTGAGVYRTTDGGANWTQVNNGITETIGVQALMIHPDNPNIAWVCIFDGVADAVNGLYKTTDGGTNWFPIINGIGTIKNFLALAMSPTDPNTIYLGSSFSVATSTGPSVIYKSTDGGSNWVLSSNGLPTDPTEINPVRTLNVSTANPNVVTAGLFMNTATLLGGFYVSTDAGANWVRKHNGLPSLTGLLIRSAAIRPLFDNQFYVGLDGGGGVNIGVWATTDGGDNWFDFNGGTMFNTYTIRALVFNPTGNHTLFAGCGSLTGQGVYEYTYSFVPVELVSFSAEVFNGNVNLSWTTATEINNFGFEVERSSETTEFRTIGFVDGSGTTTEPQEYSYIDRTTSSGTYFYRLKQVDLNGRYEYFDAIEVDVKATLGFDLGQNYPNPFNPGTAISYQLPVNSFVTLIIYDVLGNEVAALVNEQKSAGTYEVEFNASDFGSGVYFYTLRAGDYVATKKMILMK
jgi:hypothetical protein